MTEERIWREEITMLGFLRRETSVLPNALRKIISVF
jgi:hypothetical protein